MGAVDENAAIPAFQPKGKELVVTQKESVTRLPALSAKKMEREPFI